MTGWKLRAGLFGVACFLGAIICFNGRLEFDQDSVSYIDYARVLMYVPFWEAPNGYWSPLFPTLLAFAYRALHPSPEFLAPIAMGVFWVTFCFALASYFYFERWLIRWQETRTPLDERTRLTYSLFGFTTVAASFSAILKGYFNPDVLFAGFFLLACGSLLKFKAGRECWCDWLLLPVILTLGYLSKAIFFPLAFVFCATLFWILKGRKYRWVGSTTVLILFLGLSAMEWLPLSLAKHRFSFGEAGKINYVIQAGVTSAFTRQRWFVFWDTTPDGVPLKHPMRLVTEPFRMYDMNSPVPGVYPAWNDPSYWMEGLKMRFLPMRQLALLVLNTERFLAVLFQNFFWSIIGLLVVVILAVKNRRRRGEWPYELILPVLAGTVLYGLVVITTRYCAAFFSIGLILAFTWGMSKLNEARRRQAFLIIASVCVIFLCHTAVSGISQLRENVAHRSLEELFTDDSIRAARELPRLGIPPGTPISFLDETGTDYLHFLLNGDVRLVGLVEDENAFWNASPQDRKKALDFLRSTGAKALFCMIRNLRPDMTGWVPVGKSPYAMYPLD